MRDKENKHHPDESPDRLAELQALIVHERVLLAKVKFKNKRLSGRSFDNALLMALTHDIEKRLAKLQIELRKLSDATL